MTMTTKLMMAVIYSPETIYPPVFDVFQGTPEQIMSTIQDSTIHPTSLTHVATISFQDGPYWSSEEALPQDLLYDMEENNSPLDKRVIAMMFHLSKMGVAFFKSVVIENEN